VITLLRIGAAAACSDGYPGEVRAVVIDPIAATVTHLVVEPEGRSGLARLVPLGLVETEVDVDATPGLLRLGCTEAEFMNLDEAEETLAEFALGHTVPVQLLPPGWRGADEPVADGGEILRIPERETIDVVPPGAVEEHRGDHVHAADGDIGQLRGFRLDPSSGRVTHVLLGEGHLWGRKEVAIPFDKIAGFDHGIRLSLTRRQVQALPPADNGHSG
jgi:hypothetical protein